MRKTILLVSALLFAASTASASLNVVATLPWIGSLAKELGGDRVEVTTLVKPDQDPHMIEARPSMILAGRKADIFMYNGLDLEIGYLPLILESAKNPKILPGGAGNFDCSAFVEALEKSGAVDRSMGDVHPLGNPHYHYSPANVLKVAEGMADALTSLDTANAAFYKARLRDFSGKMKERGQKWENLGLKGKKFIAYHKLFEYLAHDFGFSIVGYIEPKPGIPPSAAHIEKLLETIRTQKPDGILISARAGMKEAQSLAAGGAVRVIALPGDVGGMSGPSDWFGFMEGVLGALR